MLNGKIIASLGLGLVLAACGSAMPEGQDVRPEREHLNGKADGLDWLTQPPADILGCPVPIPSPTFPQPAYVQQIDGVFDGADSAHLYRLMGNNGQPTGLKLAGSYPGYYGVAIAVYDPDGNKVAGQRKDSGTNVELTFTPNVDGQYMVAVYSVSTYAYGSYTLTLQCGGGQTSCDAQDAHGQGLCMMWIGYKWNGSSCEGVSGCSCAGSDCNNLYNDAQSCAADHVGCGSDACWGSWLDQNGNCRGPADGVLPDSCCKEELEKKCGDLSTQYGQALQDARKCAPFAFAPQCMVEVQSGLQCGCPTYINLTAEAAGLTAITQQWNQLRCASQMLWACPAVMCAQPVQGVCDVNGNTCSTY